MHGNLIILGKIGIEMTNLSLQPTNKEIFRTFLFPFDNYL